MPANEHSPEPRLIDGRLDGPAFPSPVTITATDVDVALLRQQRDFLLNWYWGEGPDGYDATVSEWIPEEAEGLINLLDHMLDVAEGYATERNTP